MSFIKNIDNIEIGAESRLLLKCTNCAKEYTGGKDVNIEVRAAMLENEIERLKDVQASMLKQAQIEALEWAVASILRHIPTDKDEIESAREMAEDPTCDFYTLSDYHNFIGGGNAQIFADYILKKVKELKDGVK